MSKAYEYRCRGCGDTLVSSKRLSGEILARYWHTSDGQMVHVSTGQDVLDLGDDSCFGPIKRCWSGGFVWPKEERGH